MKSLLAKATRYEVDGNEVRFFSGKKRLFTMRKKVILGKSDQAAKGNKLNGDFRIISHKESGEDVERNMQKTSINFSESEGQISANVGCNSMSGRLTIKGNTMEISQMISTKMGCPEDLAGLESSVIDNLDNAKSFKREANHLYIYNAAGRLIMFLEQQSFED
jgi:heat shock protein HslJ